MNDPFTKGTDPKQIAQEKLSVALLAIRDLIDNLETYRRYLVVESDDNDSICLNDVRFAIDNLIMEMEWHDEK